MIFPTEAVYQFRQDIASQMVSGQLSEADAFARILEADPDDAIALRYFALAAIEEDRFEEAEEHARGLIRNRPNLYEGYLILSQALIYQDPTSVLAYAVAMLALEKLEYEPEALDLLDPAELAHAFGLPNQIHGLPRSEALERIVHMLKLARPNEPPEVTAEVEPLRLVHELRKYSDSVLPANTVDAILNSAEACAPLLTGILKEWAEDQLAEEDYPMPERALALLGEIGNPAALPAILEFLTLDDDELSGPADWAFRRIARRSPEAALEKLRQMIPSSEGEERVALAQQLALMPDIPGRDDAISSITAGIGNLPSKQQEAIVAGAITGLLVAQGGKSFIADLLERQHAGILSRSTRATLREIREEAAALAAIMPEPEVTIYDICCREPEAGEDEPEEYVAPHVAVRQPPKPGRNDPCWCGSGKKYKKCHLDSDERRQ